MIDYTICWIIGTIIFTEVVYLLWMNWMKLGDNIEYHLEIFFFGKIFTFLGIGGISAVVYQEPLGVFLFVTALVGISALFYLNYGLVKVFCKTKPKKEESQAEVNDEKGETQ